ncbi:protein that induces appearance of [PIN+] prion when overproduced [Coemansia helicoidea]|uniref:Protein that induces appearance of [PIN+] prion when overproduced n=1 Tax=Coemansia helicoidea TaxID=1286919 RepID=A0ACC1L6P9_9FUNG|nr:protein that induces appearance of [PIN+] prion when overproduced [Coemansia helicoidea]
MPMPVMSPVAQGSVLQSPSSAESSGHSYDHPLVVYLSTSIRRDVRLLAAMGAIAESGMRVICSYLPYAVADDESGDAAGHDEDTAAVLKALSASMQGLDPAGDGARRLNRQRSETAPLRAQQPAGAAAQLQIQRGPGFARKDKPARHEGGLSARLGAFFNRLTLDSEGGPRPRGSKGSITTPGSSPRAGGKAAFPASPASPASSQTSRAHERSMSDALQSPELGPLKAAAQTEAKLPHRVTVSHCQAPLGIGPKQQQQLLRQEQEQARKPSQGSQRSGASSASTASATLADHASAASNRSSNRSSAASTLANRKRSFTHIGLSMESLSTYHAQPTSPLAGPARSPLLRRANLSPSMAAFQARLAAASGSVPDGAMARLAAPSNSLGLVLQSSSAVLAAKPKAKPLLPPVRAQRHHAAASPRDLLPKSPASPRSHCGLSSIVAARHAPSSPKTATSPTMAFPPMPSEACQAAMLSGSAASLATDSDAAQSVKLPGIARAFSDSAMDSNSSSLASLVAVATASYDYASGVKGDLEFAKGERIVIQSKVNDDWWFGSILPEAGRGSTGRSGMFPRSHVSLH